MIRAGQNVTVLEWIDQKPKADAADNANGARLFMQMFGAGSGGLLGGPQTPQMLKPLVGVVATVIAVSYPFVLVDYQDRGSRRKHRIDLDTRAVKLMELEPEYVRLYRGGCPGCVFDHSLRGRLLKRLRSIFGRS